MKARDLAALAALGIAGKMAYDKFGNKKDATAKTPAAKKEAEQEAYNYDTKVQRDPYLEDINEFRTRGGYLEDNPEFRAKDAYIPESAVSAVEAKPVAKAAVSRSVAATPAAAAPAAQAQPIYDNAAPVVSQMPDAKRITPYNSDIMYADTVQRDPNINTGSETNQQAYARMKRQGTAVAQTPNAQAQARILRQGVRQVQTPNAQAQARLLRQGAGRAKGGAVKMASGGMASSKPSGASRGDGIAQRGRTRGTLR
jgi:hypothetical protein